MSNSVSLSRLAAASKCRRRTIEIIQTMGTCNEFSLAKLKNLSFDLGVNFYPVENYCGVVLHESVTKADIALRDRMKQSLFCVHYKAQA